MVDLPRLSLILGGARSGKTRHALSLAESHAAKAGIRPTMIATAQAFDDEMRERIAMHREERADCWDTIEAPLALAETIAGMPPEPEAVIVVDCLTLWLTNLMLGERDIDRETVCLLEACSASPHRVLLISNEVGMGIVPADPLSRGFRDEAGRLHQAISAIADAVTLIVAGIPMIVKVP